MAIDYTGNSIPTRNPSTTPADNAPGVLGQDVLLIAAILKEFLPIYKTVSDAVAGKATSADITSAINALQTTINTSLANKVDVVAGKGLSTNDFTSVLLTKLNGIAANATAYTDAMAANAVGTLIQTASTNDRNRANHTGTQLAASISDFITAAQAAVPSSQLPLESNDFVAEAITDATPLRINKTTELARIRGAISVTSGGSYDPATGVITITGGGGTSYFGANGTHIYSTNAGNVGIGTASTTAPYKKLQVVGGVNTDAIHFTGGSTTETDAFSIKPLVGVGIQFTGGWIAFQSTFYNQGNGNMTTDGNFYLKTNGNKSYFFTQKGLAINAGTDNDSTAWIDVNGGNGYEQLRLRTTYTPTGSADANGNVGSIAHDANYFYIKTSAGWKRSALSTF